MDDHDRLILDGIHSAHRLVAVSFDNDRETMYAAVRAVADGARVCETLTALTSLGATLIRRAAAAVGCTEDEYLADLAESVESAFLDPPEATA